MTRAILLSGGEGSRVGGDIPKQYIEVSGKMIIEYSLNTLLDSNGVDSIVIAANQNWQEKIILAIEKHPNRAKFIGFSLPGKTRQLSIYNALKFMAGIADDADSVFIHDAARPNLTEKIIKDMSAAMNGHDGVLPALPMKDTVYMIDENGSISALLDRRLVIAGQAPEQFLFGKYLKANENLISDGRMEYINGSTEPAFLAGMDVITIPGCERNYKITTRADLVKFSEEKQ